VDRLVPLLVPLGVTRSPFLEVDAVNFLVAKMAMG